MMAGAYSQEPAIGFFAPVHRALSEPILLGGAPRAVAIANAQTVLELMNACGFCGYSARSDSRYSARLVNIR